MDLYSRIRFRRGEQTVVGPEYDGENRPHELDCLSMPTKLQNRNSNIAFGDVEALRGRLRVKQALGNCSIDRHPLRGLVAACRPPSFLSEGPRGPEGLDP